VAVDAAVAVATAAADATVKLASKRLFEPPFSGEDGGFLFLGPALAIFFFVYSPKDQGRTKIKTSNVKFLSLNLCPPLVFG
jgi:hypothetical protein